MSAQDAVRFLVRAGEDPALLARLGGTMRNELTKLGNAHGFEFTASELEQVLRAEVGELTDAQLEQASGGVGVGTDLGLVAASATGGGAIDPNAVVQYVLRESYMQTTEDLRFYAEKVKYFNTAKKLVRDYLSDR